MYYILSVEIEGFWGKHKAGVTLRPDINILIGNNGTGKTTFMNLLQAVLKVDRKSLLQLDFEKVVIKLKDDSSKSLRTIKVEKKFRGRDDNPVIMPYDFGYLLYKVGNKSYYVSLEMNDLSSMRYHYRYQQVTEEYNMLKKEIALLVNIASLSVHRKGAENPEERLVSGNEIVVSPIDQRLNELIQHLTTYQLSLSNQMDEVALGFRKSVLVSTLYDSKFDKIKPSADFDIDIEELKANLIKAYTDLDAYDKTILNRINAHISALKESISAMKNAKISNESILDINTVTPLPLLQRTQHIINLSTETERRRREIFRPISLFLTILKEFITDKNFKILPNGDF